MPESEATAEGCPRCGGRGWVVEPDRGAGTAKPCPCRAQGVVPRLLAAAGIPPRYRHCKLANFHVASESERMGSELLRARRLAEQYAEGFLQAADGRFRQSGLLFVGPPGVGKTHLAVGVLVDVIQRCKVRGRFVEFTSLLHQIQSTFDPGSPESKREILDPLVEAELLVLDELGAQQATPWVRDVVYLVINNRYTRRLPTLFTTNYRLEPMAAEPAGRKSAARRGPVRAAGLDGGADAPEPPREDAALLSTRLPAMLVSRLFEMAQPVLLSGVEDFRREQAVHGAHLR
jgi:DNA replication protein DnaC